MTDTIAVNRKEWDASGLVVLIAGEIALCATPDEFGRVYILAGELTRLRAAMAEYYAAGKGRQLTLPLDMAA